MRITRDEKLNEFLRCCKFEGLKVTDVKWEDKDLFCTFHTPLYGVQKNVKVNINLNSFILRKDGIYLAKVSRETYWISISDIPHSRGTLKTLRKTKYK